ncbi:MAG: EGFR-like transmembrane domain-containing protein [Kiritimatiellia bacterium]
MKCPQLLVALSGAAIFPVLSLACSTPVYQYALAWWLPDAYVATVFHSNPLSAEEKALLERFEKPVGENLPPANVWVQTVDVNGEMNAEARALYDSLGPVDLPVLVLQYPPSFGDEKPVWKGRLNEENVVRILDSPARRKIAERIIAGDVGVWVFIESGKQETDQAAWARLEKEIQTFEKEMKAAGAELPPQPVGFEPPEEGEVAPDIYAPVSYTFSIVRISRSDHREEVLLAMLLNSDRELEKYADEPITIPVFAQGRALYPLVGETINTDNVLAACGFMVGPCSCQVKAMNPGVDLILAANWQEALKGLPQPEQVEPELRGVFVDSHEETETKSDPTTPAQADSRSSRAPMIGLVAVLALAIIVIAGGTAFLIRRSREIS